MEYDLIIIGAGPAGLTAAIYAARYKLNVAIISKNSGGLASVAHKVCNFPTYNEIKGFELMKKFINQVEEMKIPIFYNEVVKIETKNKRFIINTSEGEKYISKKIIFSSGTERLKLNVPGENRLLGKGVSYCATCDAPFFKDKTVAVIGGGDSALTAALLLKEFAKKVHIIYRKESFSKAEPSWVEQVSNEPKITKIFSDEVIDIIGEDKVEALKLKSGKKINVDGIFIEIGSVPKSEFIKSLKVGLTEKGYIITDKNQKTNIEGFFAAGDITNNPLKQIVTACGEGATAAFEVYNEIKKA